jgi:hypothetical protein
MYHAMVIVHYQTQWLPTVVIIWSITWFLVLTWSPSMIQFHWTTLFSHWGCQMSISHELFDQCCVLAVQLILMCRTMIWPYGGLMGTVDKRFVIEFLHTCTCSFEFLVCYTLSLLSHIHSLLRSRTFSLWMTSYLIFNFLGSSYCFFSILRSE